MKNCVRISVYVIILLLGRTARADEKDLFLRICPGWGYFGLSALNEYYIDGFARQNDILHDNLRHGPMFSAELGTYLYDRYSFNFGISHSWGNIRDYNRLYSISGEYLVETVKLHAWLISNEVKVFLFLRKNEPRISLGAGASYFYGGVTLSSRYEGGSIEDVAYEFYTSGIGPLVAVRMSYKITRLLSLGSELGYRYYAGNTLKHRTGNWVVDGNKVDLDFSGPYVNLFLGIN